MKTEAPTEAKLESLREQGIVPVSPMASRAIALGGAASMLVTLLKKVTFQWPSSCTFVLEAGCDSYIASLKQMGTSLGGALLVYVVLFLAATLVQTRGYFRFQFTRASFGESSEGASFVVYLLLLVFTGVFVGLSVTTAPKVVVQLFQSLHLTLSGGVIKFLTGRIYLFSAFCGFFGAICWLFSRIQYQQRHRMSRAEILSEGRQ